MKTLKELIKDIKVHGESRRTEEALGALRNRLRLGGLSAEEWDRAGRALAKTLVSPDRPDVSTKVLLLGQVTTSWLSSTLTAVGWGRGSRLAVTEGGFDNVIQSLEQTLADAATRPDVVVLLPWLKPQDFPSARDSSQAWIDSVLDHWGRAWDTISSRLGSKLLHVGFDYVDPGAMGYCTGGAPDGRVRLTRDLNQRVRATLPPDAYFLDLEAVSGSAGRAYFYDQRRYFWTKQPFSETGTLLLAEHVYAGVRALTTGPKKVLVLDLDNTLWGGVVGETGPLGISLGESPDGEAFTAFQRHVKDLASRGVLLALASKNNKEDGLEPFHTNREMILKLEDIAAWEICWEPKGTTIARLAHTLNLGLDSFVFFDDNPAEREQVRQALPEVEVVDVPEDPADYVRVLQSGLWFETVGLTSADSERVHQYAQERNRRQLESSSGSLSDYLRSLEMRGRCHDIDDNEMQRVVQLLSKTNQFNLTTRRHSREDVARLLAKEGSVGRTYRIADRFGDHGLIAVIIGVPEDVDGVTAAIRIDTWLMSCRVISRTVEQFVLRDFSRAALRRGFQRVLGEFIPTKKNALVSRLYDDMGFQRVEERADGTVHYALNLNGNPLPETFVTGID